MRHPTTFSTDTPNPQRPSTVPSIHTQPSKAIYGSIHTPMVDCHVRAMIVHRYHPPTISTILLTLEALEGQTTSTVSTILIVDYIHASPSSHVLLSADIGLSTSSRHYLLALFEGLSIEEARPSSHVHHPTYGDQQTSTDIGPSASCTGRTGRDELGLAVDGLVRGVDVLGVSLG